MSTDSTENPDSGPITPAEADAVIKPAGPTAARSSMWTLVTRVSTMPIGLLTSALMFRYLGKEDMGNYAYLVLLGALVLPCLSLGFGGSIVYFISSKRYRIGDVVVSCLTFGLLQGLANTLILWPLWKYNLLGLTAAAMPSAPMILTLVSLPLQGANLMLQRAVLGNSWFAISNWLVFATNILGSLLLLGFVIVGNGGLLGAAIATLCMNGLVFALTLAVIVRYEPISWSLNQPFFREGLSYGLRIWMGDLAVRANLRLDQLVISWFYEPGLLGIYSVAVKVSELLWLLPDSLAYVLFNKIAAEKDQERRVALTERVHRGLIIIMIAAGVVLALTRTWAIRLLGGSSYLDAAQPLLMLIPGTIAMTTTKVITKYVSGSGRPGASSSITAIGTALSAILYLSMIPAFGIWGAAAASSLGYLFMAVVAVIVYRRLIAPTPSHLFRFRLDDLRFLVRQLRSLTGRPSAQRAVANPTQDESEPSR